MHRLTFMGGGVLLLGGCKREEAHGGPPRPVADELTTSHQSLTDAEYTVMAAACDRILPRDEDPGALDANVPEYVDRMLLSPELAHLRDGFTTGLAQLDRRSRRAFHGKGFAQASAAERDQVLMSFKDSPPASGEAHFYDMLVALTMEGFLGDPSYGGNKDHVGWELVGFGTSEPPPSYDGVKYLHQHRGGG